MKQSVLRFAAQLWAMLAVLLLVSLLLGLLGFWLFAVPVLWNNYKARQRRNQWKNQWK